MTQQPITQQPITHQRPVDATEPIPVATARPIPRSGEFYIGTAISLRSFPTDALLMQQPSQ